MKQYYVEVHTNFMQSTKIYIKPEDIPNYNYIPANQKEGILENYVFAIYKAYCNKIYDSVTLRIITNNIDGLICEWNFKTRYFFYDCHETCKDFLKLYRPAEYTK